MAAGFAAECVSMVAFAQLQQGVLGAAGTRLSLRSLLAIAYTSNAIAVAVPVVGSGMATVYAQRQFRARGAEPAAVSLVLLIAGVISTVAFAIIVAVGAILSGNPAAAVSGLVTSLCAVVAAGLLVVILHSPRGRDRMRRPVTSAIRLTQHLVRRPAGNPDVIAAGTLKQLGTFDLGLPRIGYTFGCALVNWSADALCLSAAVTAIGVPVPWDKLVLVWSAGVAATGFSLTPYGLGVADIALIGALIGAGLRSPDAVGAVLLYRVISFKIVVTLPWIGYQCLHNRRRRDPASTIIRP